MTMTPEQLVPVIYEAAVEPELWQEVLRHLSGLAGNSATYLCHVPMDNPSAGYTWLYNFDPSSVDTYKRDFAGPHYEGVRACMINPVGSLIDRRAVADDAKFLNDPGHQALFGSQRLVHGVFSPVFREEGTFSALLCFREKQLGPIEQRSTEALQYLLPHLKRAIGIHQRMAKLTHDRELLSGALHDLNLGVVTLAADMRILFANREAERILNLCDGINQVGGRLVLWNATQKNDLQIAVRKCRTGSFGKDDAFIFVARPSGAADYTLTVSPFRAASCNGELIHRAASVATIFITDPTNLTHLPSAVQLAARFRLTASEAEVARLVATGKGIPYVASVLSVSVNTARTHLKSIYSKVGVNQQANLTRLIVESFPSVQGGVR